MDTWIFWILLGAVIGYVALTTWLARLERAERLRLKEENLRLREVLRFDKLGWEHHRPSYALVALYEGDISLAKYCEWVRHYVEGQDDPLPIEVMYGGGFERTLKEMRTELDESRQLLLKAFGALSGDPATRRSLVAATLQDYLTKAPLVP